MVLRNGVTLPIAPPSGAGDQLTTVVRLNGREVSRFRT